MHATCAGLEQVAEQGHEQLHARQALAQTPGTPQTKEELVDSEYGSGQDTEPLRPSSSGAISHCTCEVLNAGLLDRPLQKLPRGQRLVISTVAFAHLHGKGCDRQLSVQGWRLLQSMAESSAQSAKHLHTIMYALALCASSLCIVAADRCTLQFTQAHHWPAIRAQFRVSALASMLDVIPSGLWLPMHPKGLMLRNRLHPPFRAPFQCPAHVLLRGL